MASPWASRQHLARLVAALITVVIGLATLALPQPIEGPPTSYAGRSVLTATIFVAAGLGLTLAGLAISVTRRTSHVGDLALLAAFLWFAPAYIGWHNAPPLVRSFGMAAAAFTFPVMAHLVLSFLDGRVHRRVSSAAMGVLYLEAVVVALVLALVRDPFFDPGCWANCTDNVFLAHSMPRLARSVQLADRWFVAAAAASLATICTWRLLSASRPARRTLLPVAGPGVLFGASVSAHAVSVEISPKEDVSHPAFLTIFLTGCAAAILLAAGLLLLAQRTRAQRRSVARIGSSLGEMPAPGSLASALRGAVGDPDLELAYWLPDSDRYVDANGRPVSQQVASPGRALTALVRDGRRIAVVSHTVGVSDLEREIGAAVRLGLENERLQAEVLARLEELRASRARIVETGDAERRAMERDLHDAAQQGLLALSYDIRLARAQAETSGNTATATLLSAAVDEAQTALGELRGLAHGIYPAILAEAGLGPALATFADEAPLPVEILAGAEKARFSAPIETAAYLAVVEAVDDCVGRGAGYATVEVVQEDRRLVITVEDDGAHRSSAMVQVADRVGAVGGTLRVEPRSLSAEFPCE